MDQYRELFPGLKTFIYADTAAAGLLREEQLNWRQEQDSKLLHQASAEWPGRVAVLEDTRSAIRDFFKAGNAEVALTPNFSIGLNLLLDSQDNAQNVLLIESDYPSLNWPFEKRGFNTHYVRANESLEDQIVEKLEKNNISILALSLVQWLDGIAVSPVFLRDLKSRFPSLLIIADGTQYCGAFDLNFGESGIDVLGASGYKWLLGGYGNGFMLIDNGALERFSTPSIGFHSVSGIFELKDRVSLCKQLEPGHLDSLSYGTLHQSILFLNEIGVSTIERRNRELTKKAIASFGELGCLDAAVQNRPGHGCIFRLHLDLQIFDQLIQEGVRCSWRSDAIRLSFHFYNTEKEIDQITEIIKTAN